MVAEIIRSKSDIKFDQMELKKLGLSPIDSVFLEEPESITEHPHMILERDEIDATMESHDALQLNPLWWLLEIVPLPFPRTNGSSYKKKFVWNRGRGRQVPVHTEKLYFHISVKMRIECPDLGYKPRLKYRKGTKIVYTL